MLTFTCHDGLQMRIRFERKNKNRAAAELSLQRDASSHGIGRQALAACGYPAVRFSSDRLSQSDGSGEARSGFHELGLPIAPTSRAASRSLYQISSGSGGESRKSCSARMVSTIMSVKFGAEFHPGKEF